MMDNNVNWHHNHNHTHGHNHKDKGISRRAALATLGMAGAAVAAGIGGLATRSSAEGSGNGCSNYGIYNVLDYEPVSGDDGTAIQAAINECYLNGGGIVYVPSGTYLIANTVRIKSNVTLLGAGSSTILRAASTLPDNKELVLNQNFGGGVDVYDDENMTLSHMVFEGNSATARETSLVTFVKATEVVVENCVFRNHTFMGIAIGGCFRVQVVNSRFLNLGRPMPSIYSAPALWTGAYGDGSAAKTVAVDHCLFQDNNWSGCYFMPQGGRISHCTFINNGESSIFSNESGKDLQYTNNYIDGTRRSNISASGLETGAFNIVISGNRIMNCQNDGISMTDVKDAIVTDNLISNNGRDPSYYSGASGIGIITYDTTPGLGPQNIIIANNRITDDQATKTQGYGISAGGIGNPVLNVAIRDNNLAGYRLSALNISSAKWGAGSYTDNNTGA